MFGNIKSVKIGKLLIFRNIWAVSFIGIGIGLSISWGDSLLGFTAFLSGILCVFAAAVGNKHTYSIGVINCVAYAVVSYKSGLFGEVMLNAGYYLPLQFAGFYMWGRNTKAGGTVEKKGLNLPYTAGVLVLGVLTTYGYGRFLSTLKGQVIPYVDSFTTVFSIIASILMLLRFREYWILYILVNAVSVFMWSGRLAAGVQDSMTMVIMWSAFLVNSIYGAAVWYRGSR